MTNNEVFYDEFEGLNELQLEFFNYPLTMLLKKSRQECGKSCIFFFIKIQMFEWTANEHENECSDMV